MPKTPITKIAVTITVDKEVKRKASMAGINISKVCENALRVAVHQMHPLNQILENILHESMEVKQ